MADLVSGLWLDLEQIQIVPDPKFRVLDVRENTLTQGRI